MKTERAFSEVIGVILIISLVLILSIVIIGLFFGSISLQPKSAYILPEIGNPTLYDKNFLLVFHRGGDEVYLNANRKGGDVMGVYIDTPSGSSRVQPDSGIGVLKPGKTIYIYYTPSGYRMTDVRSSLIPPSAMEVIACPLSVRLVDENAKQLIAIWNLTDCERPVLTGPAPTVSGLNTTTGNRGWPAVRLVNGANFLNGAIAKLNRSDGIADIGADGCTYISSKQLLCTFNLKEKTPSLPRYNVVVTNPDGKQGMRANHFTLNSQAPAISGSTPGSGKQGTTVTITRLRGNYFQPDAVVTYNNGTTSIPLTSINVVNMTSITGTLVIPSNAPTGYYSVTVTNTDKKTVTRTNRFTVTSNTPTVSGLNSTTGWAGWVIVRNISGTNFQNGATALFNRTGYPDIPASSCTYISSARLICTFNLVGQAASPTNAYNVVVTNPDTKQGMRKNYFTITSAAPTVTSSVPASGQRGTAISITNLIGTNFQQGTTVTYWHYPTGTSYSLGSVSVPKRTQIAGTLTLPPGAPTGAYNITVTNPDGQTATRRGAFTVYADAKPTITGISPGHGQRGTTVTPVTVTGSGFQSGARIRLYNGSTYLYIAPTGTVTATRITTSFSVGATVVPNVSSVRVTNPDGQYAILQRAYTIDP